MCCRVIDVSVIANILTSRFADHQPYHRQSQQFERQGISLAGNTLVSLVRQASEKLEPVYRAIIKDTLSHRYLMMDPTPVPLMSDAKKGSTKEAALWTYRALDGPVFFEFAEGKHGATPARTLSDYKGILQTDGANNFGGVPTQAGVTHLECWAHLRRYFVDAAEDNSDQANLCPDIIDRLFRRERYLRRFRLAPEQVLELRRRYSLPEIDRLFKMADKYVEDAMMRKTPMPKAVHYLLGHEKGLRECFLHAPSRIDNNLAENSLHPVKLGRRTGCLSATPTLVREPP